MNFVCASDSVFLFLLSLAHFSHTTLSTFSNFFILLPSSPFLESLFIQSLFMQSLFMQSLFMQSLFSLSSIAVSVCHSSFPLHSLGICSLCSLCSPLSSHSLHLPSPLLCSYVNFLKIWTCNVLIFLGFREVIISS